jgi:hypothetical protein
VPGYKGLTEGDKDILLQTFEDIMSGEIKVKKGKAGKRKASKGTKRKTPTKKGTPVCVFACVCACVSVCASTLQLVCRVIHGV